MGESALANDDPAGALESFERLTRLSPRDAGAQRKRAIALATRGRMAEALADTVDLDVFSPPRADWINKTDAYLRGGR